VLTSAASPVHRSRANRTSFSLSDRSTPAHDAGVFASNACLGRLDPWLEKFKDESRCAGKNQILLITHPMLRTLKLVEHVFLSGAGVGR